MRVGHIGSRAGSKGVPGKALVDLCGKPLIDWSLEPLLECADLEIVVVSTDCDKTHAHVSGRGITDIGVRPSELATDDASKWDVWKHSLQRIEEVTGKDVSVFLDLDCTSPLRLPSDIQNALELFERESPDMVMACCHARKNPYFNLLETDEVGSLHLSKELPSPVVARQHAPVVYEHTGSVYVVKPQYLRQAKWLYDGRVIPYVMPPERSHDIDSEHDLFIVRALMEQAMKG